MKKKNHITSETAQHINRIHILPSISRSESNRIMKFSQLIEYSMRNNFLEKLYTKCGESFF